MGQLTDKLVRWGWINQAGQPLTWRYWHPTAADPSRPSRQARRLMALAVAAVENAQ